MTRAALAFDRPGELQATTSPEGRGLQRDEVRLLVSTRNGHRHARFRDLPSFLEPGSLLVVNRSAVLPASIPASSRNGAFLLNLSTRYGSDLWLAVPRPDAGTPGPLPIDSGDTAVVADRAVRFITPYPGLPRLWFVRGPLEEAMNAAGSPIRYRYLAPPWPALDAYQTMFADEPGSAESPSAALPFTPRVVDALRTRGVRIAGIVLHAGVSSHEVETDVVEDHILPPEPFRVPAGTARAVNAARAEGRAVIAVGTTVVRALESAWRAGAVHATRGFTRVFVHPGRPPSTVDGLITGLHDPHASHLAMLDALAGPDLVRAAYAAAVRERYLWHEFGDSHLLLPRAA